MEEAFSSDEDMVAPRHRRRAYQEDSSDDDSDGDAGQHERQTELYRKQTAKQRQQTRRGKAQGKDCSALDSATFGELKKLQSKVGTKEFTSLMKIKEKLKKQKEALAMTKKRVQNREHHSEEYEEQDSIGGQIDDVHNDSDEESQSNEESSEEEEDFDRHGHEKSERKKRGTKVKRAKNAPREESSRKRPVGPRQVVEVVKKRNRDPRFDDLSGVLHKDQYQKAYSFLDNLRAEEIEELRKSLKKEKDPVQRERMSSILSKYRQQQKQQQDEERRLHIKRERNKAEREAVKQGKRPYFLKRADEKKLALTAKFNDLTQRGAGGAKKLLAKRRKRMAAKDRQRF
eukprot:Clim_evm10s248 gene=Clim_evmTU10s248